jgi:UDP-N-acetyl-D-mannosaminuronate dehydrogenase
MITKFKNKQNKIAVIGLGYVGLPIALAFAKEGANIIVDYFVSDIEPDADVNAKKICEIIESFGQKAIMIEADISKEEQVKKLIEDGYAYVDKTRFIQGIIERGTELALIS